jgi:hypothetical protein
MRNAHAGIIEMPDTTSGQFWPLGGQPPIELQLHLRGSAP